MSLDVYDSEQVVHYGPDVRTYWGWCVTASDYRCAVYPFPSAAAREAWVAYVLRDTPKMRDPWEARELAALLALAEWGEEADREIGRQEAFDRFESGFHAREWEEIEQLAADYDPCADLPPAPGELGVRP